MMGQALRPQCASEEMPQVKNTNTTHDVWSCDDNQNLDVWQRLQSHKSVHYEMATNVTKEFLSMIQKMNEVWKTTLSWDRYSIYNKISLIHFQPKLHKEKW